MNQIEICNVRIHNVTLSEAVNCALSAEHAPFWVVTPNAVMLEACAKSPALASLLCRADLSLPDGAGVLLAAKRRGTPLTERVAGIAFGEELLSRAAADGLRVFLLGGGEGVATRAAERLSQHYPSLCICGTGWGYFARDGEEDERITSYIRACRPDVLLVCMGFPLQEEWIDTHLHRLDGVRVVAGLGGSIDVWSGRLHRAPKAVSQMGLEWAWRMAREPKRIKKLPAIVRFLLKRGEKL